MTRNMGFSKLNWTLSRIFWRNAWMNNPNHRHGLPHEAEPDRDIIEALFARFESQIEELKQQVQSLSEQVQSLTERLQKPSPRNSSLPPSSEHPHGKPLRSLPNDEPANTEDKKGTNGISKNSFRLSNAKRLSHACPNPVGVAAA